MSNRNGYSTVTRNGDVSFWWADLGGTPTPRPAVTRDHAVDVAIVGAGFTGLWTAHALHEADPSLRIALIEQRFAGFGASGRNGGWLTGEFGWSRERLAQAAGADAVLALQQHLIDSVDEVIAVAATHGIDADIVKAGALRVATAPAELTRLRAAIAHEADWGLADGDSVWIDAGELRSRIVIADALAADWSPHAARIQPAKLVRGLAEVIEGQGLQIFEGSPVTRIEPHRVITSRGVVSADVVIRATEGFTARLPGSRRDWLPMNSAMIVTAPLTDRQWAAIGWDGCEVVGDMAHAYCYAQRTRDGRIAIGGRGIPYRFGSRLDTDGRTQERTIALLRQMLIRLFPTLAGIEIDHAWCGVLAVPRDWCPSVAFDARTGLAWAGGYVGTGVAASNLAGRSLAALITGGSGPLTELAWVDHSVRRWEPEPLRWLGARGLYMLYRAADRREHRSARNRTSVLARAADVVAGR